VRSPLDHSPSLSALTGCNLFIKKEHISITGSYKERGALNKLMTLSEEEKSRGVICSSAGNHAQAVSYHSTRLGVDSVIVMPINAPFVKVIAIEKCLASLVRSLVVIISSLSLCMYI
jgi:threonine dehydratase